MTHSPSKFVRRQFDLRGQVQGVGFRPFVYRIATEHGLGGVVANTGNGAVVEVEGAVDIVERFAADLTGKLPPLARISEMETRDVPVIGETVFRIVQSESALGRRPEVTPDAATCGDCLRELFDPGDRRYRYPFINCTNCGPRYSIIRTVPYDRPATTMAVFELCERCRKEYEDPADRRHHAQPNACPDCGPALRLVRPDGAAIEGDPIERAARMLHDGGIVAIKGVGGYHLACRADLPEVVESLRERKLRDGKPLAVMTPDIEAARRICVLTEADEEALKSPAAPIALAGKRAGHGLAEAIAPGCRDFGVFLPYAPVHHLLFAEGIGPLVMTSANLAGQPLTYRDEDALATLGDVADAFLTHNREIFRPIDDSVVLTFRDVATPIRRARGYAPRPIRLREGLLARIDTDRRVLAVGGELKSTVCLLGGGEATLSEHLGDLSNADAYRHFIDAIERLKELYEFTPDVIACDMHPQYLSSHYARRAGIETVEVQHHQAHIVSLMAEHGEAGPIVGLSCDGVGYGTDGAAWGCEVLLSRLDGFERLGHLDYFPQVGGNVAAIETWRPAAALLRAALPVEWREVLGEIWGRWETVNTTAREQWHTDRGDREHPADYGRHGGRPLQEHADAKSRRHGTHAYPHGSQSRGTPQHACPQLRRVKAWHPSTAREQWHNVRSLDEVLDQFERQAIGGLNAPNSSSLGRVFDAVSYILGLCERNRHEAEAAIALEAAADVIDVGSYGYEVEAREGNIGMSILPAIREIVGDLRGGRSVNEIAARFHETVAAMLADAAALGCERAGLETVGLSGGCFANRRLLERIVEILEGRRLRVLYHRRVPCGDGGIALGQALAAVIR